MTDKKDNNLETKKVLNKIYKLWKEYKRDRSVFEDVKPPMGIVFSLEGFWYWLIKNYIKK